MTTTNNADYLKQDAPVRGQNYACVSFVSPENVIRSRDVYDMCAFVRDLGQDVVRLFETVENVSHHDLHVKETLALLRERHAYLTDEEEMQQQLELFRSKQADRLQKEFQAQNGPHTSTRGFKIRSVHDTLEEANISGRAISRNDPVHNVFVTSVGKWCPWDPTGQTQDSEAALTEVNTLLHSYDQKVRQARDLYEHRKREKVEAAKRTHSASVTATDTSV